MAKPDHDQTEMLDSARHDWVWVAFQGWQCKGCGKTATEAELTAARLIAVDKTDLIDLTDALVRLAVAFQRFAAVIDAIAEVTRQQSDAIATYLKELENEL